MLIELRLFCLCFVQLRLVGRGGAAHSDINLESACARAQMPLSSLSKIRPTVRTTFAGLAAACAGGLGRIGLPLLSWSARAFGAAPPQSSPASHGHQSGHQSGEQDGGQLGRLSAIVGTQARQVERADRCHSAAAVRLDAALYELEQLRDELAAVVDPALLVATDRLIGTANAVSCKTASAHSPSAPPSAAMAARAGSSRSAA